MKVLVADKFEKVGLDGLRELGCNVQYSPDVPAAELPEAIRAFDPKILIVRGKKVNAAALEATVGADRAAVENAKVQLNYATIRAPLTGKTGLLQHCLRAADGGPAADFDARSICLLRSTLAYHDGLADFAFAMQGLGSAPLSLAGDAQMRSLWRRILESGMNWFQSDESLTFIGKNCVPFLAIIRKMSRKKISRPEFGEIS